MLYAVNLSLNLSVKNRFTLHFFICNLLEVLVLFFATLLVPRYFDVKTHYETQNNVLVVIMNLYQNTVKDSFLI